MISKHYSIGDIVSLKSHPYCQNQLPFIISGEPLQLPPMMVVIEVHPVKTGTQGRELHDYTCLWFSSKRHKFERTKIKAGFLKLLFSRSSYIKPESVEVGDLVSFTTLDYELNKKKSTLHFDDATVNEGMFTTAINSLLSFLPPILQVVTTKESKTLSTQKEAINTGLVSSYSIKCMWFNPIIEKFSEETIPIEALQVVPPINNKLIEVIQQCISDNKTLKVNTKIETFLIKPRNITARSGYYFLRAYDYLTNNYCQINLSSILSLNVLETPFINTVPKFNITENPAARM